MAKSTISAQLQSIPAQTPDQRTALLIALIKQHLLSPLKVHVKQNVTHYQAIVISLIQLSTAIKYLWLFSINTANPLENVTATMNCALFRETHVLVLLNHAQLSANLTLIR